MSADRCGRSRDGGLTRHLGLDLGGTNSSGRSSQRAGDDVAHRAARARSPTRVRGGPGRGRGAARGHGRHARIGARIGRAPSASGCPACTTLTTGTTSSWSTCPGGWRGVPVGGPLGAALGLPTALINDARAFGLAELRLGAARGVDTMIGLTLGTGIGGVVAVDGRVLQGYKGRRVSSATRPSTRTGRSATAAIAAVSRRSAAPTRSRRRAARTRVEEAVAAARAGDDGPSAGSPRPADTWASASPTRSSLLNPDRVVLGGGVAGAGELHPRSHPGRDRATGPRHRVAAASTWSSPSWARTRAPSARPSTAPSARRDGAAAWRRAWVATVAVGSAGRSTTGSSPGRLVVEDDRIVGRRAGRRTGGRSVRDARLRGRPCPWLGRPRRDGRPRGARWHEPDAAAPRCHLVPADGRHGAAARPGRVRGDGPGLDARRRPLTAPSPRLQHRGALHLAGQARRAQPGACARPVDVAAGAISSRSSTGSGS